MPLTIIMNSIVCVGGAVVGVMVAGASIISIATMTVSWRGALLVAAELVPVMFAVSGVGAWLAQAQSAGAIVVGLVALTWIYGLAFVLAMLVSFKT